MKTIINTTIVISILVAILLIMRRENEMLNSKIINLNGVEATRVEILNHEPS